MEDLIVKQAKKFNLILQKMSTLIRLESHNHADFKASKTTFQDSGLELELACRSKLEVKY